MSGFQILNKEGIDYLKEFFDKNGIGQGIEWDVERSTWYPIFDTKDNAKKFIKDLNELFDKTYLKK